MSELFAKKRKEAEDALANKQTTGGKPNEDQIAERKAKLLAQRDALRKAKEQKR